MKLNKLFSLNNTKRNPRSHPSSIIHHPCAQRGGMMMEMLLTLALVTVMLPFIVNFQRDRIEREKNIAIATQMESVNQALERYIDIHKKELLLSVGKNITRVNIADLEEFGAPADTNARDFQIRILKSSDRDGRATLQGVVVLNNRDISALRTREIVNMGGGNFGFIEQGRAFGAFGTWRTNAIDFGVSGSNGIIETTRASLNTEQYLFRLPSANQSDATMMSNLNLSGHNIVNAKFMDMASARFEEVLKSETLVTDRMIFQTRVTIDNDFETVDAAVAGTLSSDSKNMTISNTLNLSDTAKLTSFTSDNLWVMNLNLSGLSISGDAQTPTLKINQAIDMVGGSVTAVNATVGFTGSITPKLIINERIEDSLNPAYFWDVSSQTAKLNDASFGELNRMAPMIFRQEGSSSTESHTLFGTASANRNATAGDFMNIITEMQQRVTAKYRQLNLD